MFRALRWRKARCGRPASSRVTLAMALARTSVRYLPELGRDPVGRRALFSGCGSGTRARRWCTARLRRRPRSRGTSATGTRWIWLPPLAWMTVSGAVCVTAARAGAATQATIRLRNWTRVASADASGALGVAPGCSFALFL